MLAMGWVLDGCCHGIPRTHACTHNRCLCVDVFEVLLSYSSCIREVLLSYSWTGRVGSIEPFSIDFLRVYVFVECLVCCSLSFVSSFDLACRDSMSFHSVGLGRSVG